ncbi:hypothetical protein [Candidatus Endoriftia persephonae]|jgi:hypothetical protein|uniref:GDPGP1-like N-terminal domain-containing protein n=2 Tax=Gammaproteobacteria TaxID=1236 RepID=G2FGZ7_9GAMM|nr:hypothetical protein [Candidatus Endoriftia persephone]EGW53966.1 hypothetical protein TevJSym_as00600 [endosymbiont of Tevnia jerichonana (vent Tica)]USF87390.1 hypothetical protein L0Y14_14910 [Candidatus Endoriftia persephone]
MPESPFSSFDHFSGAFVEGLRGVLQQPGLGAYILVHANAVFDEAILTTLEAPLRQRFEILAAECREALGNGREINGAADDLLVFLKLMAIGFDGVQLNRFRREGPWALQFNHLRSFRPARMATAQVSGIHKSFNPAGFHFNKPFLRREVFWAGSLHGLEVELLYNKFPFVPMHGLLVPERLDREPQFLSHPYHIYIWRLTEALAETLSGVGFGYNSYGAYASVNHLHFQMFLQQAAMPIADPRWVHNGGPEPYPLECQLFSCPEQAWEWLNQQHLEETSYNLLYQPGCMYAVARRKQGSYQHSPWTAGFGWSEVVGVITTFNQVDFETLEMETVLSEMKRLRLG